MNIYQYKTTIKHPEKARLPDSHPPGQVFPDPHSGAGEVGVGSSTPRQASGLRSQAPHKAGRVGNHPIVGYASRRGGIQAATRRCNDSPTSSEARAMVWGGMDSSRSRPRRGRTIREIRARGDGINGPLRGPKLTIPHTPHLRSLPRSMWGYHCIAASRLGWQNAHAPRARRCRNTHPPRRA